MQRYFYASANDLIAVVEAAQAKLSMQYTPMGLFESPPSNVAALATRLAEELSEPNNSYLVTTTDTHIRVRAVPQVGSGTLYAVDQLENQDSITLTTSAWYSPTLAVRGCVATASTTAVAKRIYDAFSRAIERSFRRINSAWVGPEAEAAWRDGARLAIGPDSPREYDLQESNADAV